MRKVYYSIDSGKISIENKNFYYNEKFSSFVKHTSIQVVFVVVMMLDVELRATICENGFACMVIQMRKFICSIQKVLGNHEKKTLYINQEDLYMV